MAVRWLPSADATLRRLHAEGLPFSRIGHQMGISKNSVVGRAHRLGLEKREQPPELAEGKARKVSGEVQPRAPWAPRAVVEMAPKQPAANASRRIATAYTQAAQDRDRAIPGRSEMVPPKRLSPVAQGFSHRTCQWPSGDRETGYRFECRDATKPGRPYCVAHASRAYVPNVARATAGELHVHAAHHAAALAQTATRYGVRLHADGVGA